MIRKTALVLEGGGFRGCYTAGALQWLHDHGIIFEYTAGISATALYSFYYLSDNLKNLHDVSVDAVTDPNMIGLRALIKEGSLVAYNYMAEHYCLPTYPDDLRRLRESDRQLEVGVYNMTRDCLQYKDKWALDEGGQLLKAACVLPLSNRMTEVDGECYFDGGIDTMVSIERAKQKGFDRFLCIVTKDKGYVRKPNNFFVKILLHLLYRKNKNMLNLLDNRPAVYYRQMDAIYEQEEKGKALLFRPTKDCGVKRFSGTTQQLNEMYQLGWQDMEDRKEEILRFLEEGE